MNEYIIGKNNITAIVNCRREHMLLKGIVHPKNENVLTLRSLGLFLHQIWRNVSLHQCLSNGCSAVNGCRQNESLIKTS